jgi:hypothetical protein
MVRSSLQTAERAFRNADDPFPSATYRTIAGEFHQLVKAAARLLGDDVSRQLSRHCPPVYRCEPKHEPPWHSHLHQAYIAFSRLAMYLEIDKKLDTLCPPINPRSW